MTADMNTLWSLGCYAFKVKNLTKEGEEGWLVIYGTCMGYTTKLSNYKKIELADTAKVKHLLDTLESYHNIKIIDRKHVYVPSNSDLFDEVREVKLCTVP